MGSVCQWHSVSNMVSVVSVAVSVTWCQRCQYVGVSVCQRCQCVTIAAVRHGDGPVVRHGAAAPDRPPRERDDRYEATPPDGRRRRQRHCHRSRALQGTTGYNGVQRGTSGYIGVHRGTSGYIGVHRGTSGYIGVHRGTGSDVVAVLRGHTRHVTLSANFGRSQVIRRMLSATTNKNKLPFIL